jgi:hypothetical protein
MPGIGMMAVLLRSNKLIFLVEFGCCAFLQLLINTVTV